MAEYAAIAINNCGKGISQWVFIEDGWEGSGVKRGNYSGKPQCPEGKWPKGAKRFTAIGPQGLFISPQINRETLIISCQAICKFRTDKKTLLSQISEIEADFEKHGL